ncbi:B3 domain-containing transcription factor VRN1-like [Rutidosis leptorrhynchoides]|uniref:B3 domain-containing transcription factor VRN1-like n=1 Tax=Rutidosis leptorrhynchoides TaxID=125765 RepID=UPI003A992411
MKPHGRLTLPENPVNFLIVILEDTLSTGIRIPEKFTEKHEKALSNKVTLKVPNGDVWEVKLKKSNGDVWLKKGWGEFAKYYGVKFGHFLMFKYEGLSKFDVVIFKPNATEIEYPNNNKKDDHVKNNVDKDATKDPVSCSGLKTVKSEDETDEEHEIKKTGKKQIMEEATRALEKVKADFKCDKPFFMVYIYRASVSHQRGVLIPAESRKLLSRHETFLLQLEDDDDDDGQKTWEVDYSNNYLGDADWLMFVKDNGIKAGDVCVFKLIDKRQNVLAVAIFRSAA